MLYLDSPGHVSPANRPLKRRAFAISAAASRIGEGTCPHVEPLTIMLTAGLVMP
jgi:hypothetical protein